MHMTAFPVAVHVRQVWPQQRQISGLKGRESITDQPLTRPRDDVGEFNLRVTMVRTIKIPQLEL